MLKHKLLWACSELVWEACVIIGRCRPQASRSRAVRCKVILKPPRQWDWTTTVRSFTGTTSSPSVLQSSGRTTCNVSHSFCSADRSGHARAVAWMHFLLVPLLPLPFFRLVVSVRVIGWSLRLSFSPLARWRRSALLIRALSTQRCAARSALVSTRLLQSARPRIAQQHQSLRSGSL